MGRALHLHADGDISDDKDGVALHQLADLSRLHAIGAQHARLSGHLGCPVLKVAGQRRRVEQAFDSRDCNRFADDRSCAVVPLPRRRRRLEGRFGNRAEAVGTDRSDGLKVLGFAIQQTRPRAGSVREVAHHDVDALAEFAEPDGEGLQHANDSGHI